MRIEPAGPQTELLNIGKPELLNPVTMLSPKTEPDTSSGQSPTHMPTTGSRTGSSDNHALVPDNKSDRVIELLS